MNDRELLELAAKAAGIDYLVWTPGTSPIVPAERRINGQMHWNPIHDDGDALRLAVTIDIRFERHFAMVTANYPRIDLATLDTRRTLCERVLDDYYAATRRAIVRAAAAIGKEM